MLPIRPVAFVHLLHLHKRVDKATGLSLSMLAPIEVLCSRSGNEEKDMGWLREQLHRAFGSPLFLILKTTCAVVFLECMKGRALQEDKNMCLIVWTLHIE